MTEFTAYLVGSDGWFEYDDGPAENAETAVFGWLNFAPTDEIEGITVGGGGGGLEPFMFHVTKGE